MDCGAIFCGKENMQVNTQQYMSTDYYSGKHNSTGSRTPDNMDYREFLRQKIREMSEKIRNGETEPVFQTGAGAYTIKEWNRLIERVDSVENKLKEEQKIREEKLKEEKEVQKTSDL